MIKGKLYLKISIIVAIILSFSTSGSLSCFGATSEFGTSGNKMITSTRSGPNNYSKVITAGNNGMVYMAGMNFYDSVGYMPSFNNYISDNFVIEMDWGEFALNIGVSMVSSYLGSIAGNSLVGLYNGGTQGLANGFSNAATLGASSAGVGTTLANMATKTMLGQTAAIYTGLICDELELSTKATYIAQAVVSTAVSSGFVDAGALYSNAGDNVFSNIIGTVLTHGAPVLEAGIVTSLVDDEDILSGDIPLWVMALSKVANYTVSGIGYAIVDSKNYQEKGLIESDPKNPDKYAHRSGDKLPTSKQKEPIGWSGKRYDNTNNMTYAVYGDGFSGSRFFSNVIVQPFIDAVLQAGGYYVSTLAVQETGDFLQDQYGWDSDHWANALITGTIAKASNQIWNPLLEVTGISRAADWLGSTSVDWEIAEIQRDNREINESIKYILALVKDIEAGDNLRNLARYKCIIDELNSKYGVGLDPNNTKQISYFLSHLAALPQHYSDSKVDLSSLPKKAGEALNDVEKAWEIRKFVYGVGRKFDEQMTEYYYSSNTSLDPLYEYEGGPKYDGSFKKAIRSVFGSDEEFALWMDYHVDALEGMEGFHKDYYYSNNENDAYIAGVRGRLEEAGGIAQAKEIERAVEDEVDFADLPEDLRSTYGAYEYYSALINAPKGRFASATTADIIGEYDAWLNGKAHIDGYEEFLADPELEPWQGWHFKIYGGKVFDALQTSWIGTLGGGIQYLHNKYVKQEWLGLNRYDDTIKNLGNAYDQLKINPYMPVSSEGLSLSSSQIYKIVLFNTADNDLTGAQAYAISWAVENGMSFAELPETLRDIAGAKEYYSALEMLDSRQVYVQSQKFKLFRSTQLEQLIGAIGINLATSVGRGIVENIFQSYAGGSPVYEDAAFIDISKHSAEGQARIKHLAALYNTEFEKKYAPNKGQPLDSNDKDLSSKLAYLRSGELVGGEPAVIIQVTQRGLDSSRPELHVIPKSAWDDPQQRQKLDLDVINGDPVEDNDIASGKNYVYYYKPALTVPLIADVYNEHDLWTSIKKSVSQSMMQAWLNGFSLGWPQSFSGKSITGIDWANYTSNMHSYIRAAANGISIVGSALTSSHLHTASSVDIPTAVASIPWVADKLGLKYMKFVQVVNAASPTWVYATFESVPPMLNQRTFMPYDRNLGIRLLSKNAIGINDFRSINALDHTAKDLENSIKALDR